MICVGVTSEKMAVPRLNEVGETLTLDARVEDHLTPRATEGWVRMK